MQEIWNREPASKSLEAAAIQRLNDEFNNERLNGTSSTSMAGVTQAHALLSDSMVYGRHPDVLGGPAFTATQVPQARAAVSDSMAALASMSLLPVQKTGADKQLHQDKRQVQSMTGHGTQAQHDYNSANMMRRQQQAVQQRPPAHMQPQHRGAAEDPHSFELYLKQLVANAQQQQQVGEQRAQAAASSRTAHAPSVIQPRASSFNHANSATQQVCNVQGVCMYGYSQMQDSHCVKACAGEFRAYSKAGTNTSGQYCCPTAASGQSHAYCTATAATGKQRICSTPGWS